ncbi:MAG TPA: chorismate synthase [Desulfomonilaceae bacterium]|nr:chorismate synthase [Desulfomonilaceae bacterium]
MLRFLTAGESHGPELTVILEGLPAGLGLTREDIDNDLARRQRSEGSGERMSIEKDVVKITGGVMAGRSTGAPISMVIPNKDFKAWSERDIAPMTVPRPGHADLTAAIKYGYGDLRLGLERASARETAARVAVGAICRKFLARFNVTIGSYVLSIGTVAANISESSNHEDLFRRAEASPVRCPDEQSSEAMLGEIRQALGAGETLGGVFQCVGLNVPPGLGSHVQWDRRLSARLMAAVASIPAIKGVEFGSAFQDATATGTKVHDKIVLEQSDSNVAIRRAFNRAGGVEGGMTNGEPLVIRAAMKPISTTLRGIASVDLATGKTATTIYERSDICAVPRAAVVAEAMMAFVVADALAEKLGGDSLDEMIPRFRSLKTAKLDDLPMDNVSWRFGYE